MLVLEMLSLIGTSALDLLLAHLLPRRNPEPKGDKHERNYEQVHPVPDRLPTEAPYRLLLRLGASLPDQLLASHRALLIPHVPGTIITNTDESTMNQELV